MCGRYTIKTLPPIAELFGVQFSEEFHFVPRYNVAPTQEVPVVAISKQTGQRKLGMMRWGLIPSWAKEPSIGNRMINARAESVGEKPAFRNAFNRRRCLVPADGFYEWRKVSEKSKQPYYIRLADDRPFAFAGLWEYWKPKDAGDERGILSFTVLTTTANELMAKIHDRMPVIIDPRDYDRWLDPTIPGEAVRDLLAPFPAEQMYAVPISTYVNKPANDDPRCVESMSEDAA